MTLTPFLYRSHSRKFGYDYRPHLPMFRQTLWELSCPENCAKVARRLRSPDILEPLGYLFIYRGLLSFIRSDNGPEFTAKAVRSWLKRLGVQTLFIEPGSPWENGYNESFNGKLRDKLLNGEIFTTLLEAKVLIENWRNEYNQFRPHSSLNYQPPAPETIEPKVEILT
jgi:putative transposase